MGRFKDFITESYMGNKGDKVFIRPQGKGNTKTYILIKDKTFDMIDMTFDSTKSAEKYADKKGLKLIDFKESVNEAKKSKSASKVLKLMDAEEDGQDKYMEFVKKVAKEDKISVKQLEKELDPWI